MCVLVCVCVRVRVCVRVCACVCVCGSVVMIHRAVRNVLGAGRGPGEREPCSLIDFSVCDASCGRRRCVLHRGVDSRGWRGCESV